MTQTLVDTLLERSICFSIDKAGGAKSKHFTLCQPPLGVVLLTAPIIEALEVNELLASSDIALEAMRLAGERRELSLRLIAIYTLRGQKSWLSDKCIQERISELSSLSSDEIAQLLIVVLSLDSTDSLIRHYGIDEQLAIRQRIAKTKGSDNSGISVGGKTIYGSLIDDVAQRYGWTMRYILWEISYSNIKMLMADATAHYPLTQDEMAQIGLSSTNIIRMDEDRDDDIIASILQD